MSNLVCPQDVQQVADRLNIQTSPAQVKWVAANYNDWQSDDPSSNWVEVVESMLYSLNVIAMS